MCLLSFAATCRAGFLNEAFWPMVTNGFYVFFMGLVKGIILRTILDL